MGRSLKEHGYRDPVFVGKGSFAKVYRVRDEKRDFQACKISKVTEQWEQECRNSREICHPLFPAYREHWTDGEWGYLVMEFWDGCDLRKMLDRRGRFPGKRVMSMQWADCWQLCWEMTQTVQSDNLGE